MPAPSPTPRTPRSCGIPSNVISARWNVTESDEYRTLGHLESRGVPWDFFQEPDLCAASRSNPNDLATSHNISKSLRAIQDFSDINALGSLKDPGLQGFRSQIKVWMKRDDIEAEIKRLKEHVDQCYSNFMNIMNQTIEIIASDTTHKTLEFQYLSTQALVLADHLQQLGANGNLVLNTSHLAPAWNLIFINSVSPKHILHNILLLVLKINDCPAEILFTSIQGILNVGEPLAALEMSSEATAWHLMTTHVLHRVPPGSVNAGVLWLLANSLENLSRQYQRQLQWDLATKNSQQSVDMCHLLCEISPDVDYQPLLATILITHSLNLHATGQLELALGIAQEAVAACRLMVGQLIEAGSGLCCWTEKDKYKAVRSHDAFFTLARALSSMGWHIEAYEARREGFQTVLRSSGTRHCPSGTDIDGFLDQMCKLAEAEEFSLTMLADCMISFCDFAQIYPGEFSLQFLRLLYAYVYLRQESNSPEPSSSLKNLHIFLEPNSKSPIPVLKMPSHFRLNIDQEGSIIKDSIWAFYSSPWAWAFSPLIKGIFIGYFDQAATTLQEVISFMTQNPYSDSTTVNLNWALQHISFDILPVVPHPKQAVLLARMADIVGHFWEIIKVSETASEARSFSITLSHHFWGLWLAGLLDDALVVSDEALKYLRPALNTDDGDNSDLHELCYWHVFRTIVFFDMGRIDQAIQAMHKAKTVYPDLEQMEDYYPAFCMIQTHILQRTAKHQEALQMLQRLIPILEAEKENHELMWHILLTEFATVWGHIGQLGKAVKDAEKAVLACQKDMANVENQKFALVHSLTTLSNCLAAVGRNTEALFIVREAASIYNLNASHMWADIVDPFRRQFLGAKVFLSLSLRLATLGQLEEALSNSEKATKLFCELISLTPGNLPSLASSLQNQALIFWNICRQEEAISACKEAVTIMRQVAESEAYFLPDLAAGLIQLAVYLSNVGDNNSVSATTVECKEVQEKIGLLPPQPDFLFEKVVQEPENESYEPEERILFSLLSQKEVPQAVQRQQLSLKPQQSSFLQTPRV
ncbi:hypothetical protein C8R44DRAFT_931415 [Mycena epipterygia]|nr:hypothetical protein C8R44DRAFT_931415 [Mycena epipterygia]